MYIYIRCLKTIQKHDFFSNKRQTLFIEGTYETN